MSAFRSRRWVPAYLSLFILIGIGLFTVQCSGKGGGGISPLVALLGGGNSTSVSVSHEPACSYLDYAGEFEQLIDRAVQGQQYTVTLNITTCYYKPVAFDLYFSLDPYIYTSDIKAGNFTVQPSLGKQSFIITVPNTVQLGGQYYIGSNSWDFYPRIVSASKVTISTPDLICTAPCNLDLSWSANKEKSVNSVGGGYKVHYDLISEGQENMLNLPYVSGANPPLHAILPNLSTGLWYIYVNGYSSMNSDGTTTSKKLLQVN